MLVEFWCSNAWVQRFAQYHSVKWYTIIMDFYSDIGHFTCSNKQTTFIRRLYTALQKLISCSLHCSRPQMAKMKLFRNFVSCSAMSCTKLKWCGWKCIANNLWIPCNHIGNHTANALAKKIRRLFSKELYVQYVCIVRRSVNCWNWKHKSM